MLKLDEGIYLKKAKLWLDAPKRKSFSFVSHAHSDHLRVHDKALVSEGTAPFYKERVKNGELIAKPFNEPFFIRGCRVELFPSGHILGASQILIEDKKRVVYTGDFKLHPGKTSKPIEIKPCDILIMECTYGDPRYIFPDREEVISQLINFVEETLDLGGVPILFAYPTGKAQEVMKILGDKGFTMVVHKTIYQTAKIYEGLGMKFKRYELYQGQFLKGKVLLLSPFAKGPKRVDEIPRGRKAALTGWALDGGRFNLRADELFPLSDHADFKDLITYVKRASPKKVYTHHGFSDFCRWLRKEGFDAEPLSQRRGKQLTFW